jgi:hypothetical protein
MKLQDTPAVKNSLAMIKIMDVKKKRMHFQYGRLAKTYNVRNCRKFYGSSKKKMQAAS